MPIFLLVTDGQKKYRYTLFYVISIYDTILYRGKCQYENSSNSIRSDPLFWYVRRLNFSQLQGRLTNFPYKAVRIIIFTFRNHHTLSYKWWTFLSVTAFTSRLTSVDIKAAPPVSRNTLVPARRSPLRQNITFHRHPQQNVSLTSIIHLTSLQLSYIFQ